MKRWMWTALLAVGLLAAVEQKAVAWGCCDGGHGHFFPCLGIAPGPWYLYWPSGPCGGMTGPSPAGWHYPCNFQTPVPVATSFCSDYGGFSASYWGGW